ncbi:MAG: FHA domain-containing protein [Bacteriovoracaceae bacterium]|jgi:uncharacterized RDD family membrane protein YckC|nr:FHA domain-containing protein [Bacteriovoracaceae bacterium]
MSALKNSQIRKSCLLDIKTQEIIEIDEVLSVGRQPGNDLTLNDSKLSRNHARIIRQDGDLFIMDLCSKNGTLVNETPVQQGNSTQLNDGDIIHLGHRTYKVLGDSGSIGSFDQNAEIPECHEIEIEQTKPKKRKTSSKNLENMPTSSISKFHSSTEDETQYAPAKFINRLIANIIDATITGKISTLLYPIIVINFKKFLSLTHGDAGLAASSIIFIITGVYYILPLMKSGQTLGKKILKIKLIHNDGNQMNMVQIILREYIFKLITVSFTLFTLPQYLSNKDKRALHDLLATTRVISTKDLD